MDRTRLLKTLHLIYANGDHTLNAKQRPNETRTAKIIEPICSELMFEHELR